MNYSELQQAIIEDTHRPDLASLVPRFITEAEGLIRRDLTAYLLSTTITNADRISEGIYQLPVRTLIIRSIHLQGRQGDSLDRVGVGNIRRLDKTADPIQYAEYGDGRIEFRGNPSDSHVFDLSYYGTPAPLANPTDTNELLTDHESLYIAGAKFWLYVHTQDRELASDENSIFNGVIDTLNEQIARKIGGSRIAPTYNMAGGSSY